MMWAYFLSCCGSSNAIGYRYYTDNIVITEDAVECVEVSDVAETVVIESVPLELVISLTDEDLEISSVPENLHICDYVSVNCDDF